MKSPSPLWPGLALVGLCLSAGCPQAAAPCTSTAQCLTSEVCVDARCRTTCNSAADCAAGEHCGDGACLPGATPATDSGAPDTARQDSAGRDGAASDATVHDGGAGDRTANDAAIPDVTPVDLVAIDLPRPDQDSADSGSPDVGATDAAAPVDASDLDTATVDAIGWPDVAALDREPLDAGTPADATGEVVPPDAEILPDQPGWRDTAGLDDAASTPDHSPIDTEGTDTLSCALVHVDGDGDCHVTSSAQERCYLGEPPPGYCLTPHLQTQVRPPPGSASTSGGGASWSAIGSAIGSDDASAAVTLRSGENSEELRISGLGFTVPTGAIVVGIEVEIERAAGNSSAVIDQDLRLIRNANTTGDDLASTAPWPSTDAVAVYGSPASLWGRTWSVDDVNNPGFGVSLKVRGGGVYGDPDAVARIDAVRVRVHFLFDCDDADPTIHQRLVRDADGDGLGVEPWTCIGTVPGWVDRAGDCNDNAPLAWRSVYRDSDGDGYGAGTLLCVDDSAGYAATAGDCMDSKSSVHPNQGQYFTVHRGDNSFDYNCDGVETKRADCVTTAALVACQNADILDVNMGWVGAVPGCGVSGTYRGCIESIDSVCAESEFDGVRACSTTQDCLMFSYNEIRDFATAQPCH